MKIVIKNSNLLFSKVTPNYKNGFYFNINGEETSESGNTITTEFIKIPTNIQEEGYRVFHGYTGITSNFQKYIILYNNDEKVFVLRINQEEIKTILPATTSGITYDSIKFSFLMGYDAKVTNYNKTESIWVKKG